MSSSSRDLRNLARGSGTFHVHRREILRGILDTSGAEQQRLSPFLASKFFRLPEGWTVFEFDPKDWQLCERLLASRHPSVEARLLEIVLAYADANRESVARMYALGSSISDRLLQRTPVALDPVSDELGSVDSQSLFGLRLKCASNHSATETMIERLEHGLSKGWARARLVHPMVYHFSSTPPAAALDNFLSYVVTGREHDAEKLALKLMLSDEAARETSLAFKCFIGLMGHPYDAIEFVLDHVEHEIASGTRLARHLASFLSDIADQQPRSRAGMISSMVRERVDFILGTRSDRLAERFSLSRDELDGYATLCNLDPVAGLFDEGASMPFGVLTNMRVREYPDPSQFTIIVGDHAVWHFVDAGRFIWSMLRSIYMIERAARDLEVRDAFRLMCFLGFVNPFVASTPSAMVMMRRLHDHGVDILPPHEIQRSTDAEISRRAPFRDRLWINELQWRLRRLEEEGRIAEWLSVVRSQTRLRPSYLTGINWHWVEEIIATRRLKPFRNLDGAYLFILMELETNADPLRLRLTLEPLLRGMDFQSAVGTIIKEFGSAAPALVRRYLTTQNLLATGMAPNYIAALDQRVRAMESCIRRFGFGVLLTEDVYESEVKALTAELLLTDVNAGKFEVPWETFRKDANDANQTLYQAVESLRPRLDDAGPLTAIVETPITFPNGRTQVFRVRQRDHSLFACVMAVLEGFMQHPAFGLEVVLSGRFRHNNLLQELWSAMAEVVAATIPSVSRQTRAALVEDYKLATEQWVDAWCGSRLQTKRAEKPNGLFDLIPEPKELDALLARAREADGMLAVTDIVIEWIKGKLRGQVAAARSAFEQEVATGLVAPFIAIRDRQAGSTSYREADVHLVHNAVNDAVQRRIADLRNWFDGVDAVTSGPISLSQLSLATEALFENLIPGKTLKVVMDSEAHSVSFGPRHVKIAFDMLRELYFNALRHGLGPEVELKIDRREGAPEYFAFRNAADACAADDLGERSVEGHVYHSRNEAVTREGNSGLAKIAASSATLVGHDAWVLCRRTERAFEVLVSVRNGIPA